MAADAMVAAAVRSEREPLPNKTMVDEASDAWDGLRNVRAWTLLLCSIKRLQKVQYYDDGTEVLKSGLSTNGLLAC